MIERKDIVKAVLRRAAVANADLSLERSPGPIVAGDLRVDVKGSLGTLDPLDVARLVERGGIVAGNERMLATIIWPHFWAVQILLVVLIVLYCVMHELVRQIGRDRFVRMFFGPLPKI